MRRIALWVGAASIAMAQGGPRVTGRVAMLEKKGKPSPDLGAAVVSLAGGGAAAHPVTVEIAISDKEFVPRVLVVPVGSTVRFVNRDPFDHNVFSASDSNQFDLEQYGRGETRAQTFAHAGLVRVFCNIHPRMVAYVQVMSGRLFTQPASDGSFVISDVPPGAYTLRVWHERSPEVTRDVRVTAAGAVGVDVELDARGFRWVPHKNKHGEDYPTNEGLERY
jgi:plastocyanin